MNIATTATREEHERARAELLAAEKAHMREGDELARRRRELPWVPVQEDYAFQTTAGERTLAQLFEGRSQLLVYHFMFTPEYEEGCVGCSFLADHLDGPEPHVNARDITLKVVSRGNLDDLQAYRERMGWKFDWVSSAGSTFNRDLGATTDEGEQPGFSVFALRDGVVHHTYSSWDRGCEIIDGAYHLIDLSPKGRQEEGQGGWWWRRHDEYEAAATA